MSTSSIVGRVIGTEDATPLEFWVAVSEGGFLQLDDVVALERVLNTKAPIYDVEGEVLLFLDPNAEAQRRRGAEVGLGLVGPQFFSKLRPPAFAALDRLLASLRLCVFAFLLGFSLGRA